MPSNVAVATHDWLEVVGLKLVSSIREISVGGGGNLCAQADRWDFICDNVQSLHNFGNDGFDVCVFALLFDGFRFRNEITLGQKTEFLKPQFNGLERTNNVMEAKAAILSILLQREDTMTQANRTNF